MIYLFLWENYFRKKLITSWKNAFKQKFSEHNIVHISNIFEHELSFFEQNLLSSGFFSEKNLFIIDNFPFSSDDENSENISKIQEYFLNILPKINSENIVVFNNEKADKRWKIYKEILKNWEIKDFTIRDENDLIKKIQDVYQSKISQTAIAKIIALKWLNFSSISNELDKIFIMKDFIDNSDLDFITKDIEESIFDIINDILANETKKALLKLRDLAEFIDNPYFLYNSLASNLRIYFYIFKMKQLSHSNIHVKELLDLWNRAFLVDKNYKIDTNKFFQIYEKIANIDSKMKTWKLLGSENSDMMYEIERSFF